MPGASLRQIIFSEHDEMRAPGEVPELLPFTAAHATERLTAATASTMAGMVPATFHDFFTSSAAVAGALIGLLFVAIQIAPQRVVGESPSPLHQVAAGTCFSVLINTLLLALTALIPDTNLGRAALILAVVGVGSTVGLFPFLVRERRKGGLAARQLFLLLVLLGLYGFQFYTATRLLSSPHDVAFLSNQAGLILGFFAFAMARAWELLGAPSPHLLSSLEAWLSRAAARGQGAEGRDRSLPD